MVKQLLCESICVSFEVDTGACISVADEETYVKYFRYIPLIRSLCNTILSVLGEIGIKVEASGKLYQLSSVIVALKFRHPILGINWLDALWPFWRVIILSSSLLHHDTEIKTVFVQENRKYIIFLRRLQSCFWGYQ